MPSALLTCFKRPAKEIAAVPGNVLKTKFMIRIQVFSPISLSEHLDNNCCLLSSTMKFGVLCAYFIHVFTLKSFPFGSELWLGKIWKIPKVEKTGFWFHQPPKVLTQKKDLQLHEKPQNRKYLEFRSPKYDSAAFFHSEDFKLGRT